LDPNYAELFKITGKRGRRRERERGEEELRRESQEKTNPPKLNVSFGFPLLLIVVTSFTIFTNCRIT
jgi:hypothetical protein